MDWKKRILKKRIRLNENIEYGDITLKKGEEFTVKEETDRTFYTVEETTKLITKSRCKIIR